MKILSDPRRKARGDDVLNNTKQRRSEKGIGLVIMAMLIAIGGILTAASTSVFTDMMRRTQLRIDQTKAHYLAQAGVMKAIWDWYKSDTATETNRRWAPASTTMTGTNMLFKAGYDSAGARLQSNYAYFTSTTAPSIQYIGEIGTNTDWTVPTANNIVVTSAVAVPIGDFLIVSAAMDGVAGAAGFQCVDNRANGPGGKYSIGANSNKVGPTNDANGVRTVIFYAPITTALIVGDTITVSWNNAVLSIAASASEFRNVDAFDKDAGATWTASPVSSGNATPTYINELLFGAVGMEAPTGVTFTPTVLVPPWVKAPPTRAVTGHGTALSNVQINPMYRIVSSIAAYDMGGTTSASRDGDAIINTFSEYARWSPLPAVGNQKLRRWGVYNINNGNSITLDKIKVSWTGGGLARLNGMFLNGADVWPGGSGVGATATTGDTVNIDDTVLANGGNWSGKDTYLQWDSNGPADPVTVTCQFIFSGDSSTTDAASHEVILWNGAKANDGGLPTQRTFTVTSTGQVNQTAPAFPVLKTVKAVVSATPGTSSFEITQWDEGDKNIP